MTTFALIAGAITSTLQTMLKGLLALLLRWVYRMVKTVDCGVAGRVTSNVAFDQ